MPGDSRRTPRDADLDVPCPARVYDYYLGGGNNFACDRALAKRVLATAPEVRTAALANRAFLQRVVQMCVTAGIRQFLDLGSGIPTAGNTHEIAGRLAPESRVVFVDNEPVAVAHSELLLEGVEGAAIVRADVRDVDAVLHAEPTRRLLNFAEPIALLLFTLPNCVPDTGDPAAMLARYREALAPGSYLALSHLTGDTLPAEMNAVIALYDHSHNPGTLRTRDELAELFAGFEVLDPGIVFVPEWRPEFPSFGTGTDRAVCYAGVGRKP